MARIAGVDLPREKRVEIGLTYIYGIGRVTSNKILEATGVNPDIRVKDLAEDQVAAIREYIENHVMVEGDLRRQVFLDIKRLKDIGCFHFLFCMRDGKIRLIFRNMIHSFNIS